MTEHPKRPPLYPLFVVIPQAGGRLSSLPTLLAPLGVTASSGRLTGVDLYYRAVSDMALLALRFDARFTTARMVEQITADAARIAGAVLDPGRLPDEARRRFFQSYLPQYDVRILQLTSPEEALRALARHIESSTPPIDEVLAPLEVRFRRGDQWQLARVRSLSRDGISLATGAPPRRGDLVDLEINAGALTLVARGTVVGVTSTEVASVLGAAGFGARFLLGTEAERSTLERLIAMVGDGARSLTPPPRRREARYPIRWPVLVRTSRGKSSLSALDVSRHGLFVAVDRATPSPLSTSVQVTLPLDDVGGPIQASARIARTIAPEVARQRGIAPGYGLELTGFSDEDATRFAGFVDRIGRRAERKIVVGAAPERLDALCAELTAAGYTASGAADPPSLVAEAAAPSIAPDLVVLDSSLADENPRGVNAARRALSARTVRVLMLDGEPPTACREWADAALLA
jgi:hypothetical protein